MCPGQEAAGPRLRERQAGPGHEAEAVGVEGRGADTSSYPLAPGWPRNPGGSFPEFQMVSELLCSALPVGRRVVRGVLRLLSAQETRAFSPFLSHPFSLPTMVQLQGTFQLSYAPLGQAHLLTEELCL